ncbi:MAG TPA: DegV family protein, partial [Anaerolineales bacterium]|nr:DegV family protein [Anaerolineales bacterium]
PQDIVSKYPIRVAPQVLIWDNESYLDGVDIAPDAFYKRLANSKSLPSSAQVSTGSFDSLFKEIRAEGRDILAILVSEKLSGTLGSAIKVKQALGDEPIEIINSHTVASALALIVLETAKAADQGAGLAECKALAEHLAQNTGVVFAVNTLEFLHRGGRIGGASRFIGSALNIKPILEVTNGRIEPLERIRTRHKSISRMIEIVTDRVGDKQPVQLASLHANAEAEGNQLIIEAKARLGGEVHLVCELSPVVGVHVGPGTVGLAYMAGY